MGTHQAVNVRGKDFVTIGELAPVLGVDHTTIYRAGCKGELSLCRLGDKYAVDLTEAQEWAAQRRAKLAAEQEIRRRVEAAAAEIEAAKALAAAS